MSKVITAVKEWFSESKGILQMMVGYKTPDPITENRENSGHFVTDGNGNWQKAVEGMDGLYSYIEEE
jgi:hypothetical protein